MLFVNNKNATESITCDTGCMRKLGLPAAAQLQAGYVVEEVWSKKTVPGALGAHGTLTANAVAGNGASAYFRITPQ